MATGSSDEEQHDEVFSDGRGARHWLYFWQESQAGRALEALRSQGFSAAYRAGGTEEAPWILGVVASVPAGENLNEEADSLERWMSEWGGFYATLSLPNESPAETVGSSQESEGNAHFLYFPSQETIDQARQRLGEKGYSTSQGGQSESGWLLTVSPHPEALDMQADEAVLERVAADLGGFYDGDGIAISDF